MAHVINLNEATGRYNMAYVGQLPWHGLGQELESGQPLEVWAEQAGMNHTIERSRVVFRHTEGQGGVGVMDNRHVLWHSRTKEPLGIVSKGYKVVQPAEVLEFYRDLVSATGDYELETAGVLDAGQKYWALAKFRDDFNFAGDVVKPYLLLATSCDGSMATTAQHTTVRVVCNNTLQMSLRADAETAIKVRHSTRFDAADVKARLNIAEVAGDFFSDVDTLINKAISRETASEIFVDLVAKRDDKNNITNEDHVKRVAADLLRTLTAAPGQDTETARGTAWGVVNAVTHFVDFRQSAHSDNNRFKSGQFGEGAKLKQRAVELVMAA